MKKYLFALLALTILAPVTSVVNAGSPQQCKDTLKQVLSQLNIEGTQGKHVWELTDQQIPEFKERANKAGLWAQFAQVCNSWSEEQCKGCTCGRDFSDTACSPNCGCC
jgi:hypothetical protein